MNSKQFLKLLGILALLSAFVAAGLLLYDFLTVQRFFPPRTYIGNVEVSSLSAEDAVKKLDESHVAQVLQGPISFYVDTSESYSFSPKDIGVYVLASETVHQAFSLSSNNHDYIRNLPKRLTGKYWVFPAKFSFIPEKAREILDEIAQQTNSPAVNAKIDLDEKTGGYHIYPDKPGRKLKIDQTLSNLRRSLENGNASAQLEIDYYEKPKITEAMIRENPPAQKLSAYTTYYGAHDSPNRIHNIKLIASWLNNSLLLPNEVFSAVERIGDFTADRGFKEAYVILDNELVPQLGGGTCQIGTTFYNAVALADIKVLSRRNHSFYFNIYPLGRDATVYPGSADFKFVNDTGFPILVKAVATDKFLSFRIYGTPSGKTVEFSNPAIYMLYSDGAFKPATLRSVIANDRPFRTVVVRKVFDKDGKTIKEETIRSYYKLYGEKTNVPIRRRESR